MTTATVLYEHHEHPPWVKTEITEMEAMLLKAGYADPPGLARKLQKEGMSPYELQFRLGAGQHIQKASELGEPGWLGKKRIRWQGDLDYLPESQVDLDAVNSAKTWDDLTNAGLPQAVIDRAKASSGAQTPSAVGAYVAFMLSKGVFGFAGEAILTEAPAAETVVVAAAAVVVPDEAPKTPAKRTRRKACCTPDVQLAVDPARHAQCMAVAKKLGAIDTPAKAYALIAGYMESCDQEVVVVVLLNVHFRYLGMVEVARGQRAKVAVDTTDILRPVLAAGAKSYFFSHCHPSGHAKPSEADRALTKNVEKATKLFHQEITFLDHLVVGKGEYFSIRENKLRKA